MLGTPCAQPPKGGVFVKMGFPTYIGLKGTAQTGPARQWGASGCLVIP